MIYPNADLDEAGNYLQAHVPFEIPSSVALKSVCAGLCLMKTPVTERLFFVFTREPLAGLPSKMS